jgi:hypothetical protein
MASKVDFILEQRILQFLSEAQEPEMSFWSSEQLGKAKGIAYDLSRRAIRHGNSHLFKKILRTNLMDSERIYRCFLLAVNFGQREIAIDLFKNQDVKRRVGNKEFALNQSNPAKAAELTALMKEITGCRI